jgi:hypothetical protein
MMHDHGRFPVLKKNQMTKRTFMRINYISCIGMISFV